MHVGSETVVLLLIEVLKMSSSLRNHHEIRPNRIAPHPENVRSVTANEAVPDKTLSVSLGFVWHVFSIEWQGDAEISNFNRLQSAISNFNRPEERTVLQAKRSRGSDVRHWFDLLAFAGIHPPFVDRRRGIARKLRHQA